MGNFLIIFYFSFCGWKNLVTTKNIPHGRPQFPFLGWKHPKIISNPLADYDIISKPPSLYRLRDHLKKTSIDKLSSEDDVIIPKPRSPSVDIVIILKPILRITYLNDNLLLCFLAASKSIDNSLGRS